MNKQTVRLELKQQIIDGRYLPGEKFPTEVALLREFKVSRYSLRQALQALVAERYLSVVQGSGYFVTSPDDRNINETPHHVVGVIATHIADYIFPPLISGIDEVVNQEGYNLMISNTHNQTDSERRSLKMMLDSGVDGLIVEATKSAIENPNLDLYRRLALRHFPLVFINARYSELDSFPVLTVADEASEHDLIEHLINLGHQKILGFFKIDDQQGVDRMRGFLRAYQEQHYDPDLGTLILFQSGDSMPRLKHQLAMQMESPESRPTAIACYNDQLAIKMMSWLMDLGYNVPDQVSIVGFDDYGLSSYLRPGLTTAVHPKRQMGQKAGKMLLSMINRGPGDSEQFPVKLQIRDSTQKLI